MVFFQMLLMGGYLYAHMLNKLLGFKKQAIVHVALLGITIFAFPISFNNPFSIDAAVNPMLWLLTMLLMSVGLPFFVLSATSPLSQRWFASATRREPYALYAASNVGSFIGLLSYPLLVEPYAPLRSQTFIVYTGYVVLFSLFAIAGCLLLFRRRELNTFPTPTPLNFTHSKKLQILQWIVLSAVPSSLLYGVTSYISTDIASVPLFWVIPLALYLLTFILVFGNRHYRINFWQKLHRAGAPGMALLAVMPLVYPGTFLVLHLLVFFATAIACHFRLAALKPSAEHLTEFFLWVSFGGILGGIFNTFIAPHIFTSVIEYPLMLTLSLGAVALPFTMNTLDWTKIIRQAAFWVVFGLSFWLLGTYLPWTGKWNIAHIALRVIYIAIGIKVVMDAYTVSKSNPVQQMMLIIPALIMYSFTISSVLGESVAYVKRNVFGVSRVIFQPDRSAWAFRHGTTYHGMQSAHESLRLKPALYYGSLMDIYQSLPKSLMHSPVAVMGMGVGTIACYGKPGQTYDFFEIDPLVNEIAHDTRYFTYLRDCPPTKNIYMGDGRISLSRAPDNHYGLIVLDAFTSDAIPVHTITNEAVNIYTDKLRDEGMLAFHITNRHVDLRPVLAAISDKNDLYGVWKFNDKPKATNLEMASQWVILSKSAETIARLQKSNPKWQPLPIADARYLWSDDYSNLLRSLVR